jgi:Uma2 family endonuclease
MSTAEMPSRVEPKSMTVEEFLDLPDDGVDREMIRGEVKEYGMTIRNRFHASVESRIAHLLWAWLDEQPEPRGEVVSGEGGFRLPGARPSVVGIDVAYVSAEMIAATTQGQKIFDGPPVLAVEILSPSDQYGDVSEKVRLYLEVGTVAWVVDPDFETVAVHRPGRKVEIFTTDHELSDEPYLPGFRTKVAEFFG